MNYAIIFFEIWFRTFANRIARGRNHESGKDSIRSNHVAHTKIWVRQLHKEIQWQQTCHRIQMQRPIFNDEICPVYRPSQSPQHRCDVGGPFFQTLFGRNKVHSAFDIGSCPRNLELEDLLWFWTDSDCLGKKVVSFLSKSFHFIIRHRESALREETFWQAVY